MDSQVQMDNLRELCALLDIARSCPTPETLCREDFEVRFKKPAEDLADSNAARATRAAKLIETVGAASQSEVLAAVAGWICGNIFTRTKEYTTAKAYFARACPVLRRLGEDVAYARATVGRVGVLGALNELDEAQICAEEASYILTRSGTPEAQKYHAILLGNLANIFEQQGLLYKAYQWHEKKWKVFESNLGLDPDMDREAALALNDMAAMRLALGQYEEADLLFDQSKKIIETYRLEEHFQDALLTIESNIALLETLTHPRNQKRVSRSYQAAFSRRKQFADPEDALRRSMRLDLNYADWLLYMDRVDEVEAGQLQKIATEADSHDDQFYADWALGQYALKHRELDVALQIFERLIERASQPDGNKEHLHTALIWHARVCVEKHSYENAIESYAQAIRSIEETSTFQEGDENRSGVFENKMDCFRELAQLFYTQGKYDLCFKTVERAKSIVLSRFLLQNAGKTEVDIGTLTSTLDKQTIAVQYAVLSGRVFAFLITDETVAVPQPINLGEIPSQMFFDDIAKAMLEAYADIDYAPDGRLVDTHNYLPQKEASLKPLLDQLFVLLIEPIANELRQRQRVIFVPDGILVNVPFACLYDAESGRYLVQDSFDILLAPSLTVWSCLKQMSTRDVIEVCHATSVGFSPADKDLKHSIKDAELVAAELKTMGIIPDELIGEAAIKPEVLSSLPQAELIYISGHAEFHPKDPSSSLIQLHGEALYTNDVLNLELKRSLVILSACETFKGRLLGNELLSFPRAFIRAGAVSVVATHWQVEDTCTSLLMQKLIGHLKDGIDIAHALKLAQCSFLNEAGLILKHPVFWGALVVIGLPKMIRTQIM